MNIEIIRASDADALLANPAFRADWLQLCVNCPWATPFQGPAFVATWYAAYHHRYEPVLAVSRDAGGRLQGLLPLAVSIGGGELVVAGAWQAEYHAWVCPAALGNEFPWQAMRLLGQVSRSPLHFRYLPPNTPTEWTNHSEAKQRTVLQAVPRPLLQFGTGEEIRASLNKGGNKSKLKRLEKVGRLEFRRIDDAGKLEAVFDEIVGCYDARQASVHGDPPFRNDPDKRPFHLAMMREPGLLHATVMTVGGRVAAAHLGACGRDEVQLGLIAHNPLFARHSPGKFLILFLSRMLLEEGYNRLDLTPGGDTYKSRFANAWDEVRTLDVYPSNLGRHVAVVLGNADAAARQTLQRLGTTPREARVQTAELARVRPSHFLRSAVRSAREWIGSLQETRLYVRSLTGADRLPIAHPVRRDNLDDLLAYQPSPDGGPSRRRFLAAALERIEAGQHVYTHAEGGRLLHYGWLIERPAEDALSGVFRGAGLPPSTAVINDLYTAPDARGRGLAAACVAAMLRDTARSGGTTAVAVAVPANSPASRIVERLGFAHRRSLFEQTRFVQVRRWIELNGDAKVATAVTAPAVPAAVTRPRQTRSSDTRKPVVSV